MSKLELRWLGHACFALKYKDFTVVFDPFEDNYVRGFGALDVAADLVLCSHFHNDHGAAYVVQPLEGHENPFQVTGIQTFHDPEGGKLRGENVIHVLEADG
ncbi:MAG: MBL fold metallo-hydrolase, partial [Ruminiclostridium sp.]|nr:MBL fold metallo-hydrolase [Ruminiclostridium sp.]